MTNPNINMFLEKKPNKFFTLSADNCSECSTGTGDTKPYYCLLSNKSNTFRKFSKYTFYN